MPDSRSSDGLLASAPRLFRRHLALVGLLAVSGLLLGLLLGFTRPAKYQAESKLLVGVFDAPADAIPGYVLSAQNISADYARLANSADVLDPLAEQLGMSVDELSSSVTVTAIPKSAVLRVIASSSSEDGAVHLASATADAIKKAVDVLNSTGGDNSLLADYDAAAKDLAGKTLAAKNAKTANDQEVARSGAASDASKQTQDALQTAQVAQATAQLRADGLADRYKVSQQQAATSGQIRTLGDPIAQRASTYTTAIYAAVGLAGGLLLGLFLARRRERASLPVEAGAADGDDEWISAATIGTSP